jgi:hypothetical protein
MMSYDTAYMAACGGRDMLKAAQLMDESDGLRARVAELEALLRLATNWALCQSAMDDLDARGEANDETSREWNRWMRANRKATEALHDWCIRHAGEELIGEIKAALAGEEVNRG